MRASFQRQLYLLHDPVRLRRYLDDLLVVADVILGEGAALAVFQPFLRWLIAADGEDPDYVRHGIEILSFAVPAVYVDASAFETRLVHHTSSSPFTARRRWAGRRR